jgi:hypothetical protein
MIDFVKKGHSYSRITDGVDIFISFTVCRNIEQLALSMSKGAWAKLGKPEYVTAGADVQKNHTRLYIKGCAPSEGFKVHLTKNAVHVKIPRLASDEVRRLAGERSLRWSESYRLHYVEVEDIAFIRRER